MLLRRLLYKLLYVCQWSNRKEHSLYIEQSVSPINEWWEWSLMINLFYWSGNCYTAGTCAIPYSFSTTCVKRSVHGKVSPLVYYYLPGTWSPGGSSIYAGVVPRSSVRKGLGTRLHIRQPLCSVAILSILALGRLLAGTLLYAILYRWWFSSLAHIH